MKRIETRDGRASVLDLLLVAAGAALGLVAGYLASGSLGRVTAHRVKRSLKRSRRRRGALRPGDWTDEEAEALEARAVDVLCGDAVLVRRAIRVQVLGPGLLELSGLVESPAEIQQARALVRRLPGVRHVINRLLVPGVDTSVEVVPGPSSPRAARG